MKKFEVEVKYYVTVKIDEEKYNKEFLKEFSESMWDIEDLKDLIEDIALAGTRGDDKMEFVGRINNKKNGIETTIEDYEVEKIEDVTDDICY